MAVKYLSHLETLNINMQGYELQNAVIHTLTNNTRPVNPNVGQVIYNTDNQTLELWDGVNWSSVSGDITSITITTGVGLQGGVVGVTGAVTGSISLNHLGLEDLVDPNKDSIFYWNDLTKKSEFLDIGDGLLINSGVLSNTIINNDQLINGSGYITADSSDTLTNKSGNISQWTNDVGYITDGNTNWNNTYGFITGINWDEITGNQLDINLSGFTNDIGFSTFDGDYNSLTNIPTYTQGSIIFADSDGSLTENNSQLYWDNVNNRLGIGTKNPTEKLDVAKKTNLTATTSTISAFTHTSTETTTAGFGINVDFKLQQPNSGNLVTANRVTSKWNNQSVSGEYTISSMYSATVGSQGSLHNVATFGVSPVTGLPGIITLHDTPSQSSRIKSENGRLIVDVGSQGSLYLGNFNAVKRVSNSTLITGFSGVVFSGNNSISTHMLINSTGNVGIGVVNPNEILDVNGNIKADGTLKLFDITDTQTIELNPNGNSYINENLGIGTSSPSSKLDVYGTISLNGFDALRFDTTNQSLYAGHSAGGSTYRSNAFGHLALSNNTGNQSNGFGFYALQSNTGGNANGFGYFALQSNAGNRSNGFGYFALRLNTGEDSSGFGYLALQNNTGDNSNGFGYASLSNNIGININGVGNQSLTNNTGNNSNAFGYLALQNNTGDNSNGFGNFALLSNTGGNSNAFGFQSLQNNSGNSNSAFGNYSGYETIVLSGSNNTFLGFNASYGTATTISNSTAVGANVTLTNSNTVILGDGANVGIGTTSPTEKLHVNGAIKAVNFIGNTGVPIQLIVDNGNLSDSSEIRTGLGEFKIYSGRSGGIHQKFVFSTGDNYTSGATRMTISSNGNVGINTTLPVEKLDVDGNIKADGILKLYDITNTQTIELNPDGESYINGGNVGIGTSSPLELLHLFKEGSAMINVDSGATSPFIAGIQFIRNIFNRSRIYNDGSAVQLRFESDFAYDSANPTRGGFLFRTSPVTNGTFVDAFRIDARGDVGIGTTAPLEKLDVRGIIVAGDNTATTGATSFKQFYNTTGNYLTTIGSEYSSGGFVFGYGVEPKKSSLGFTSTTNVNIFRSKLQLNGDKLVLSFASRQNTPIGDDITDFEDSFIFTNGTFRFDGILQLYDITDTQKISLNPDGNSYINGKLAVGKTTNIFYPFEVQDNNTNISTAKQTLARFYRNDGTYNPRLEIRTSTDGTDIYQAYTTLAGNLTISNVLGEVLRITTNKNVGINTTSPTEKLDVNGNIKADGILKLYDITDTQTIELNPDGDSYINGKLAVGRDNPTYNLHVNGDIGFSGNKIYFETDLGGSQTLQIGSSNIADSFLMSRYLRLTTNSQGVLLAGIGSANNTITIEGENGIYLVTDINRVFIDSIGRVGLNTLTPTERLDVVGNIKSSGYITGKRCGAAGYLASPVNVTVTTANTYYPIGVFTVPVAEDFVVGTTYPNGLKYSGTLAQTFHITWNATIESTSNNVTATIDIQKNGVSIAMSKMGTYAKTGGEIYNLSGQCVVDLDTNDEVRFVVTADTNGEVLTFDYFAASIKEFFD